MASLRTKESRCKLGQVCGLAWPHMEVHQPAVQVGAVDPFRNSLVMRIGHQQRQAEAAQQPFGSAFPVALLVAHLDQLAGEGHVVHVQAQRRTHRSTNLDLLIVDVAAATLEAVDFVALLLVLLPALAQAPRRAR